MKWTMSTSTRPVIVIQGPTNQAARMVECYSNMRDVHWCTWNDEPDDRLEFIRASGIQVIKIKKPDNPGYGNCNMQALSTTDGLIRTFANLSQLAFKIRHDLVIPELGKLICSLQDKPDIESKLFFPAYHKGEGGYLVDYFCMGTVIRMLEYWNQVHTDQEPAEVMMLKNYMKRILRDKYTDDRSFGALQPYFGYILPHLVALNIDALWYKKPAGHWLEEKDSKGDTFVNIRRYAEDKEWYQA